MSAARITLFALLAVLLYQSPFVQAGRQRYAILKAGDEARLQGTWSSGSGIVQTGPAFFDPRTRSFHPPSVPGVSYSFTRDGEWEFAKYRISPNPRKPECIQSQLIWQHGTYSLHQNGTLQLFPIAREGAQLLTSSCKDSEDYGKPEEMYDVYEEYSTVDTWIDLHHGSIESALRLTDPWGNQSPPKWKIFDPPMMLPTNRLYLQYIGIP